MRRVVSIMLFALPWAACAQGVPLTESDAVRRALTRSDFAALQLGTLEAARADAIAASTPPNPVVGYVREPGRGGPAPSDQALLVSQTFDVSGRRALRREAAEARVDVAGSSNAFRRIELAADVRQRFHDALYRQLVVSATETWTRRFARVESIVEKRARGGEASGFDRRRLAAELQTAEARLAAERSDLERAQARLGALMDRPFEAPPTLLGTLPPQSPPSLEFGLARLTERPDLHALSRRAQAAELERQAAARGWVPDVTLGLGAKQYDDTGGRRTGPLLQVSLPMPFFDRLQALERRAAAEALSARGEYGLGRARAEGELRGLQGQLEQLVRAAAQYRARTVAESGELLRIAEAAYQGGESSVLELLDAYRSALAVELTALELERKARQARIEYDVLTGEVE